MKISAIIWCMIHSLRLIQSEKCVSKYFKRLHGNRLDSTPIQNITVDNDVICAMKCMQNVWCQAVNSVSNGESHRCELFDENEVKSGQTIEDEKSVYYSVLKVEDNTEETRKIASVSSTVNTPTLMMSSSAPISPSYTELLPITSSITSNNMPAVACKKIFLDYPSSTDGTYTIFGGTANEAQVFCDMTGASTGCNGGGWTMVMRINGEQQTFKYSSTHWTNKQDYQPYYGQFLYSNSETKLSTYHTTSFTQICLGMKHNNQKGWTTLSLASTSLFDLISNNAFRETSLAVSDWEGLIPSGTALQLHCRIQGVNAVRGDTGVRIGIIATKTCGVNGDYNSRLGFGAKGSSCGQDGNNRCGNDARCDAHPNALSAKTMGYILVK